jgi:hypothetical protein
VSAPSPPREELGRLADKYQQIGALRRARARGEAVPPASVFRALARAFPGSLNELDTLPLDDVDARAEALARAAAGGEVLPWMIWLADYHALLRAALWLKVRLGRGATIDPARAEALAGSASAHAGAAVDAEFVYAVARPPGGRLVTVVLARLEATHGRPGTVIKCTLFPRGRR